MELIGWIAAVVLLVVIVVLLWRQRQAELRTPGGADLAQRQARVGDFDAGQASLHQAELCNGGHGAFGPGFG